ncbi:3-hydroxyacyl-CoA dehydrogenase NAD-binding domain-containing protein [Actinokineospora spheciospongiae]|uniref:3-hydroxyacyl-CoA dehydrogenase NAD-binding domain-containing protein n=1 Tax=Actinokineospora spheciospongiae TaxID=909613 RepID=UPI000D70FEFA|nr:3-hydroxyacyl-CoA dehydrogenase NAD-binding domain-containing protein [Actinokineospora spheciospongiae]PWW62335.1 short chain enoyl-CoA hydratase /3-hydroxyacyl-CoA dehydrogenase [Actinokineospora spheciospongiae]
MTENMIKWESDADGIVVLTMDDPNQSANTMNDTFRESFGPTVDRLEAEKDSITGVVITSAKKTFFAGGDLNQLGKAGPEDAAAITERVDEMKAQLRRLEQLGKPVVAAINGAALGGGYEIALATHHRVALDARGSEIGLPEVSLGLLPGGGGVSRTVRLLGIQSALLNVLLQGQRHKPAKAKELGLVDELVSTPEELLAAAKAWVKANPEAVQPWDVKGYRIPGGTPSSPSFAANLPAFPANLRKQLKGAPMPAPRNILAAAIEGSQVDLDNATRIETQYFVDLVCGQVSKNMIKAFFFDLQAINKGNSRPDGQPKYTARKVAVLGAGMMGAGIAYSSARAGIEVVLKDVTIEAAQKGKAYSEKILAKAVGRGKLTQEKADEVLARITPTADPQDVAGVDLVVEAVFESPELKKKVFGEVEDLVAPDALLGSNTSTLPITLLSEGVKRQEDFIGLHFFSPVDKMPLLEIVVGEKTSDVALAKAFDYALQIKKTPIVVNDSRGFFTSRVIGTFINEAVAMVGEGLVPASIEQAGTQAGYPAPPLQLLDELTLTLPRKIRDETKAAIEAAGGTWPGHPSDGVVDRMVDEFDRKGRSAGAGFYEYDDQGKRAGLWAGLGDAFGGGNEIPFKDMQERMLFAEALETVKCFDENVLRTVPDANIGSIFGIGFPPWTGGVIQYINGYPGGVAGFVARANELAAAYGERFTPPASLVAKAEKGEVFE